MLFALLVPLAGAQSDWNQLHAPRAEASSFLKSNFNKYNENYHPNYVLDGDPKTAWVEGVDGQGTGETLRVPLSRLASATKVQLNVRNGYQKSDNLLAANSAPRQVKVTVLDGGESVASTTVELTRTMGWQAIEVAIPSGKGLDAVQLEVLSVHPGSAYKDTCISDLEVRVQSSVAYNARAEQAKQARLGAWISGRLDEAAWFKARPADYPWASDHFAETSVEVPLAEFEALAVPLRSEHAALQAVTAHHRADGGKGVVLPDGVPWMLDLIAAAFAPGGTSWFEASEAVRSVDEEEWRKRTVYNARLRKTNASDRHPQAAWFRVVDVIEERGVYTDEQDLVVLFDPVGRPSTVWYRSVSDGEPWTTQIVLTFERDADGRVAAMTELRDSHEIGQRQETATKRRLVAQ